MDSRGRLGPAPPPSSPGTSVRLPRWVSPLFRLSRLAFPRERERMRGSGSPSGVLHRPRCARERGEPRAARFSPLLRGCARAGKRTSTVETSGLGLARWSAGARRRRRPGGATREGSRRATKWLGLDCCTFFFVRYIFRNKKKSPTLHTTSPASLRTRSPATAAWGDTDNCPAPHNRVGGIGTHSCWDQGLGSSQNTTKTMLTVPPAPTLYRYLSRL